MTETQRGFVLVAALAFTFPLALAPRWLGFRHRLGLRHRLRFFSLVVGHNYSVGMRSSPIQNLGGIGRSSRSSFALVDGSVNGSGISPPRSAVEQETVKNPASRIRCR